MADPRGRELIIKLNEKDASRLVRVPAVGGAAEPVRIAGDLRLTNMPLAPAAIDAQGRMIVETASPDSWFFHAGLLDLATGKLTRVPVAFEGDIWSPGWTSDGRIVAIGGAVEAAIWRFRTAVQAR